MPIGDISHTDGALGVFRAITARQVAEAETEDFASLIRLAGLDPKRALRFENWSGVDFSGSDLRGFDFTGARLNGCRFDGARIAGARFDQAEIDGANLRAAKDWEAYRRSWVKVPQPVRSDHLPGGAVFQDAPFAPEMVALPPGRFWMGSRDGEGDDDERPHHEVTIPHAIAVGRYPVTFEEWDFAQADKEWRKITGMKPRKPEDYGWGRDRRPVIDVSWEGAQKYVIWLSHKTGQPYRLLSEAEWEYACRAGSEAAYCFGDSEAELGDYAWYWDNSERRTHPVGQKKPNKFGLYDMHGNVWEWCEDVGYHSYADKPEELKETGAAWVTGDGAERSRRGGSWYSSARDVRAAARYADGPGGRFHYIGFRCAQVR
jgi:formylglycine-generating enzyme required for sulfatase activity